MMASGEYIMFLDSDDYLDSTACKDLYSIIKSKHVDMVHFSTHVLNEGHLPQRRLNSINKSLLPFLGRLQDKQVFIACFLDEKYGFTLWNKIYSAALCREAFSHMNADYLPKAQDLYAFFLLAYFAGSYYGTSQKPYYFYRFGSGITGQNVVSLAQLETYCQAKFTANAIDYFAEHSEAAYVRPAADKAKQKLCAECTNAWISLLPDQYAVDGFHVLRKYWDSLEIVNTLYKKYYYHQGSVSQKLLSALPVISSEHKIRTIGILYRAIYFGGEQRVVVDLILMLLDLGYQIVLITNSPPTDHDYPLPLQVARVVLPTANLHQPHGYRDRANALQDVLRMYNIDLLSYQIGNAPELLFDLLVAKLNEVRVIVTSHENAFQSWLHMLSFPEISYHIYRLADLVTVLSRVDETYYRALDVRAQYVPTPFPIKAIESSAHDVDENLIIWIGRLDNFSMNYLATIDMMRELVVAVPSAHLRIIGPESITGDIQALKDTVKQNGLEYCVEICGPISNIEKEYRKAAVCIITSTSEGFSHVIADSKSYGVPIVMFELPYIEIARRSPGGIVSVKQRDSSAMAREVAKILSNSKLRVELATAARNSLNAWELPAVASAWNQVIRDVELGVRPWEQSMNSEYTMIIQTMVWHYQLAREWTNKQKTDQKKAVEKETLKKTHRSREWRIGYALTRPARLFARMLNSMRKR